MLMIFNCCALLNLIKLTNDILNKCLEFVNIWNSDNFLQLNSKKTEALIIAPNNVISVLKQSVCSLSAYFKHYVKNLGVIFDQLLSSDEFVCQLKISCFFHLRNIKQLRQVVTNAELEIIVHALISSCLRCSFYASLLSNLLFFICERCYIKQCLLV